jgi:predicted SAM-dependent methyltransferase
MQSRVSVVIEKVQVGCGAHAQIPGWWNTDLRDFDGVDQTMDAAQPWPWRDQLTHVYAEHFLEHLKLDQAIAFLIYAGTALRPGGRLRLSTPNLSWVVASHYDAGADVPPEQRLHETLRMNRAFHAWGHQFLWSEELLAGTLAALGFENVQTRGYGESDDPALRGIERHGKYSVEHGHPSVVIVEAVRGTAPIELDRGIAKWLVREYLVHLAGGY